MEAEIKEAEIKTLLEFMRIKAPELNTRQNQLARVLFIFVALNILIFLTAFDGIGSVSLKDSTEFQTFFLVTNPRVFFLLGGTVASFFYFMRFGYLYYQSTVELTNTIDFIGKTLPLSKIKGTPLVDLRESLRADPRSLDSAAKI